MKKVNKISLTLSCLGIFMIATAILLQYKSFQMEQDTKVAYEKVTMKEFIVEIELDWIYFLI